MTLRHLFEALTDLVETSRFVRGVLVIWLASSFLVLFMLSRIDWIVHNELYDFGLQFSLDWANPYWVALRLIHVFLAIPLALSFIILGFDFWRWKSKSKKHLSKRVSELGKVQPLKGNSMVISCPSCRRVFSKPLVLLDFTTGKARLVNACPYCNALLGDARENEHEKDIETGVLDLDEKVETK